jgi:hypothetical protein
MVQDDESDLKTLALDAFPDLDEETLERLVSVGRRGYSLGLAGFYKEGDFSSDADYCYGVGAEIQALEEDLEVDDAAVFDFFRDRHGEGLTEHERVCIGRGCCARPLVELDNQGDDDGSVMLTMACKDARQIVRYLPNPADGRWECRAESPDYAYAIVSDAPGLMATLEREGYELNTDAYVPPSA